MKRLRLLVPGKFKSFWREGVSEFTRRLSRYEPVEVVTARELPIPASPAQFSVLKTKQWAELKRLLRKDAVLMVFDPTGKLWTTDDMVSFLRNLRMNGKVSDMVIGGPLGLPREALEEADYVVAVSGFTLTHQMTALLVLEQIYRACKILAGEPYAY